MNAKFTATDEGQLNPEYQNKVRKGINLANHNQTLVQEKQKAPAEIETNPEYQNKVRKGINLANHNQTLVVDR